MLCRKSSNWCSSIGVAWVEEGRHFYLKGWFTLQDWYTLIEQSHKISFSKKGIVWSEGTKRVVTGWYDLYSPAHHVKCVLSVGICCHALSSCWASCYVHTVANTWQIFLLSHVYMLCNTFTCCKCLIKIYAINRFLIFCSK